MGNLSTSEQQKLAYFHALGKSLTENTQNVYESKYKSSHNVTLNEVWNSSITYSSTYSEAVNEASANFAVTIFNQVELDEIYGSNGQAYTYIKDGTFKGNSYQFEERGEVTDGATFIRPWISPVDVPQNLTNEPSHGFEVRLFKGDYTEIYQTEGAWTVDYFSGIIHFSEEFKPSNMGGWGSIKATFFQYTGNYGVSVLNDGKLSGANIGMSANNTSSNIPRATEIKLIDSNVNGSAVNVYVNGVQMLVGVDCHFSANGNIFKAPGDESINDWLYWKYTGTVPNAGFELKTSDKISFVYINK